MIHPRYLVAAVILYFAWGGAGISTVWPAGTKSGTPAYSAPPPTVEQMEWGKPLGGKLPGMLAKDRQYLADFYDAMYFVVSQDGKRSKPIITSTDNFVVLHGGSLQLAIEKAAVGKYPGLDDAIDQVFFTAAGAEARQMDEATRQKLCDACAVLTAAFRMKGG